LWLGSSADGLSVMAYPTPEVPPLPKVEVPVNDLGTAMGLITVKYGKKEMLMDATTGTNADDISSTIKAFFRLPTTARLILKREGDGTVVVPGPFLKSGKFMVDMAQPAWKRHIRKVHEQHIPALQRHVNEKYLPPVVGTAQKARDHLTNIGTVVGENAAHVLGDAPSIVKGHVTRVTKIANDHSNTNSHTWTAKLWVSICSCAPGPISHFTGVPVEELPKKAPAIKEDEAASTSTGGKV